LENQNTGWKPPQNCWSGRAEWVFWLGFPPLCAGGREKEREAMTEKTRREEGREQAAKSREMMKRKEE
jgi:hypothetical protein